VRSRSDVIALDEEARAARLAEVLALYDDYGRGMDGMQLPYVTRCFRATVVDRPEPDPLTIERSPGRDDRAADRDPADGPVPPPTDDDSGMLLIDFR
jgi:hypothetical protein